MSAQRSDGAWALVNGVGAGLGTGWFWALKGVSPFDSAVLVTFVLVAVIPILSLAGMARGIEAVTGGKQTGMGAVGLGLSAGALGMLGRLLVG